MAGVRQGTTAAVRRLPKHSASHCPRTAAKQAVYAAQATRTPLTRATRTHSTAPRSVVMAGPAFSSQNPGSQQSPLTLMQALRVRSEAPIGMLLTQHKVLWSFAGCADKQLHLATIAAHSEACMKQPACIATCMIRQPNLFRSPWTSSVCSVCVVWLDTAIATRVRCCCCRQGMHAWPSQ